MLCPPTKLSNMNKENIIPKAEEPCVRVTRARAKALGTLGGIIPTCRPSFKGQKRVTRANIKRAASDENRTSTIATAGFHNKRRAVLRDVTNIFCESSHANCIDALKIQTIKLAVRGTTKTKSKVFTNVSIEIPEVPEDAKTKLAEELSKIRMVELQDDALHVEEKESILENMCHNIRARHSPNLTLPVPAGLQGLQTKEEDMVCEKLGASNTSHIVDTGSDSKDSQECVYATDMYNKIRVTELDQRPSINYMERLQRDVTVNMRGILIDWLVEVSEEYKLVPDTLYLTVNLIDRFLSQNYIGKQKLQLLGVSCMLIASKYEEICAPRIDEFCVITDNTYKKEEVLEMESEVLNLLHFQLSVPTTKTFLRRFIQVAQICYKVPCVELEFLANYLAELTLVEYSFLKFLPSMIAASVVFLAKWTLNQSNHPWNPTLEKHTNYNAAELKNTVLVLEDLQLNISGSSLNAIREKYRQQKFKCVATLTSEQPVLSLF